MRLATFNVENLFSRAAALNADTWADGRSVLNDIDNLARRIAKPVYAPADTRVMVDILERYRIGRRDASPPPFDVIQAREKLFSIDTAGTLKIVATGRPDWVGWLTLGRQQLDPPAISTTARVIAELNADVLALVEVEDRLTLDRFNQQLLSPLGVRYPYDMCVDGNDARGIDVAMLSRHPIVSVRSHIHDADAEGRIFSRDCPEYEVEAFADAPLIVLPNHFKSKGYGDAGESARRRERQAKRVAQLYRAARKRSPYVAVVGDLNDTPDSTALAPLLGVAGLRDVSEHPLWKGPVGTYGTGRAKSSKIDYILLSPDLWKRVTAVGAFRGGVYAPSTGEMWEGVTKVSAASDHAGVWVEVG